MTPDERSVQTPRPADPGRAGGATDLLRRAGAIASRLPVTVSLAVLLVVVGVAGRGLWSEARAAGWFVEAAYGLPALEAGRWWTPVVGIAVVETPAASLLALAGLVPVGILELRRGSRSALLCFGGGQTAAFALTMLGLLAVRPLPWPWAAQLAEETTAGPFAGMAACLAACLALLSSPWTQRAWVVLLGVIALAVLFHGTLLDVMTAAAVLGVLLVSRSLRVGRLRRREQRQLAVAIGLALGAIQVVTAVVPTDGPFGPTSPLEDSWPSAVVNVAVVLLVTNALHRGRRWAWTVTVLWAGFVTVVALAYVLLVVVDTARMALTWGEVDVSIATAAFWTLFLVYLLAVRRAFRVRRRRARPSAASSDASAEQARAALLAAGGGTLSWMTTWEGMQYLRTSTGIVAHQDHLGVAIALADPLGPPSGFADSLADFASRAEADALVPCVFSASRLAADARPEGWRSLIIAEDTLVDLAGLQFTGKPWAHVRTALNRAGREGVTFRLSTWAEETWGVRQQLRAISDGWVGDKNLPEMRFVLGTLQEAQDPDVRLALAVSSVGDVEGFLSWLPVHGPDGRVRGWTLDLMRRREGGFPPVMEFLIGSSAAQFRDEGADVLSLSGAPLAHEPTDEEGRIALLLGRLSALLEPVYGFDSLHRFKEKFHPRYESVHLLYRDEGDLGRIATALTRAFLPDATLRQYAAAGLEMLTPAGK